MKISSKYVTVLAIGAAVAVIVAASVVIGQKSNDDEVLDVGAELVSERAYNVLLVGTDREVGLADVMMLARLDLAGKRAVIMQIPRDTYAEYTDGSYKKLNGAYSSLGAVGMCEFLSEALGISVDRYIVTGLDTVRSVVDAIGGVDVNVPCDMKYRDSSQELYIDLKAGVQHLDGEGAEQFLRFRSGYIEGDIDRMDAQKIFIAATAQKIRDKFSLPMAYRLLAAADGIETNFSASELLNIAIETSGIDINNVVLFTVPGAEARASSGASYYSISGVSAAKILKDRFGAQGDGFDKNGAFLNEKNAAFRNIYNSSVDHRTYTLDGIAQNGIEIDLK